MISFWEIEMMIIQEKTKNMGFDVVGVPFFLLRSGEVIIPGCVQATLWQNNSLLLKMAIYSCFTH